MRQYRVFRLAPRGDVLDARWIEASADEEAMEAARSFGHGSKCELWERSRLVGHTEQDSGSSADFTQCDDAICSSA